MRILFVLLYFYADTTIAGLVGSSVCAYVVVSAGVAVPNSPVGVPLSGVSRRMVPCFTIYNLQFTITITLRVVPVAIRAETKL